jgi:hypothetical protein
MDQPEAGDNVIKARLFSAQSCTDGTYTRENQPSLARPGVKVTADRAGTARSRTSNAARQSRIKGLIVFCLVDVPWQLAGDNPHLLGLQLTATIRIGFKLCRRWMNNGWAGM